MTEVYLYGVHAVQAALQAGDRVQTVWFDKERRDQRMEAVLQLAQQAGIPAHGIARQDVTERAGTEKHQGVVAACRPQHEYQEGDLEHLLARTPVPLVLVLDNIQDPHNLGACLRSADAAGVSCVVVPRDNAAPVSAVVRKVASGAVETVPLVRVTNLARALRRLKDLGLWLVGTAGEAEQTLYQIDLTGPTVLLMGGEGKGLRRLTREHCDYLVSLPMQGMVSSLNVSVATGVCLFEALRQRRARQIAMQAGQ